MSYQERLEQQLAFIIEIDKLKRILRQTVLMDASRRENSAEHSWHLAVMAIALAEYAPNPIDLLTVIKMLLVHDLVEIDAGDTFCYDLTGNETKHEREQQAARRLFGLLPDDIGQQLSQLWHEFEANETSNAQFARALDCLQPFIHNCQTNGGTWRQHQIRRSQVEQRMSALAKGIPALKDVVDRLMNEAIAQGHLTDG